MSRHVLLLLALAPGMPLAAQGDDAKELFASFDRNKDGVVVRDEFPGSDAQFQAMDKDRNGKVTPAELAASEVLRALRAARDSAARPPRARTGLADVAEARLAVLLQGRARIPRAEWTGTDVGFQSLDLDGNGVLDAADKAAAARRTAERASAPPPLERLTALPSAEQILERFDRDQDGRLARGEAQGERIAEAFQAGDANRDGFLDREELERLLALVRRYQEEKARGSAKVRAYQVPFDAWDKNGDGRLDTDEFVERKELFPLLDRDRDGAVTREEVERYVRAIEGEEFLQRFDLNGDGRVSPEEFGGPPAVFRRMDRNGDGFVSGQDRG
ncbi:MAG: EF-hand domain-containing protein [Planctomycetes bacterium]|nr:EF-hand domain-containing protein [Planctomycetota bacterium]